MHPNIHPPMIQRQRQRRHTTHVEEEQQKQQQQEQEEQQRENTSPTKGKLALRPSRISGATLLTRIVGALFLCYIVGQLVFSDVHHSSLSNDDVTASHNNNDHTLPNKVPAPAIRGNININNKYHYNNNSHKNHNHLFVHIGKAGGSSIQVMVQKSRKKCEELTAEEEKHNIKTKTSLTKKLLKDQVCALSMIPDSRVHLKLRLDPKRYYSLYTQFLINLRDPLDRLFSWYNYEVVAFGQEPRWSTANETGMASDNFMRLTKECYPGDSQEHGFSKMVRGGLLGGKSANTNENKETTTDSNGTPIVPCDELARLCLRGDIMCFGHNYYNYETYLEEILLRKGYSADGNKSNSVKAKTPETIRIDAIRSEYSMQDFNRTVGLWTGYTKRNWKDFQGVTPFVQSLYGRVRTIAAYDWKKGSKAQSQARYQEEQKQKKLRAKMKEQLKQKLRQSQQRRLLQSETPPTEALSPEARTALCKHICVELVVYKIALRASDNLESSDVQQSYEALDGHCGLSVDEVCGTTWTFRDVKKQKKVFEEAPW